MSGHVAGVGPYTLQSYEPNKQAVLVATPGFFKQPKAKKVIVNFISSDPTLVLQARNGSADVTLALNNNANFPIEIRMFLLYRAGEYHARIPAATWKL